jgi:Tfp pilus assembly protein PilF
VLDTLGWIEHLRGNDPAAAKVLADAIRLDPTVAEAHLHAAAVFASMGMPERAETALKEALRLDPALEAEAQTVRDAMSGKKGGTP